MDDAGSPTEPSYLQQPVKRRTVLKGIGAGTAVSLIRHEGVFGAVFTRPKPGITIHPPPPPVVVGVVRPDDFVHLTFTFTNLLIDTSNPASPKLRRNNVNLDAVVVVDFGPQHVAEQVLWNPGVKDQIPAAFAGVQSRLAGSSRLAFLLPSGLNTLSYDIDTLLDWSTFTQSVVPVALPGTPAASPSEHVERIIKFVFPGLRAPVAGETMIEVPWWLVLSPSRNAAWAHATEPVTHVSPVDNAARTELWHTRLASKNGNTIDEAHPDSVRAVWARDPKFSKYLNKTATPPGISDDLANNPFPPKEGLPFRMAYTPQDRLDAVNNSANWSKSNPRVRGSYTPTPFATNRLMLTALGAYVDIDGAWPVNPNPFANSLLEWKNRSTLGRDHYVRIVNKGYLHPYGHEAVLVRESERKFLTGPSGTRCAYLTLKTFFVIIEEERTYPSSLGLPNKGRAFPFQKVEVLTKISPEFSSQSPLGGSGFAFQAFDGGGHPIMLNMRGTDWDGNTAEFSSPFGWVEDTSFAPFSGTVMPGVVTAWNALGAAKRTADAGGSKVAFANSNKPGDTTYPLHTFVVGSVNVAGSHTQNQYLDADQIRAFPAMDSANIKLPAVEKITGATGLAPPVKYVPQFINDEFGGSNPGEAFLSFLSNQAMQFATENAGGLVTPNQALSALTRPFGPVAGDLADIVGDTFNPQKIFQDLTAKILGGIPLKDILALINDISGNAEKAIQYVENQLPTELVISFEWHPDVQADEPLHVFKPSDTDPKTTAVLQGEVRQSLTNPNDRSTKFSGEITNFELNLIGDGDTLFLIIKMSKLGFKSGSGQKTDIDVKIDDITFAGALQFVEQLRDILANLGDGFGIKVDGSAITASMNLDIPSISVGVFGLSNLAFNGALTVPLTGDPVRVRFGLSTRDNPFVLTVYIFGGGGWLGIALGADGMESLEIGFEFGGKLAIDVGVASGGVEAMAGIYLKMDNTPKGLDVTLTGFLKIDGHVSVLGIVSIELEIYLAFQYMHKAPDTNIVTGTATATLKVSVLFFSISVSFTVEKSFGGNPADPSFAQAISTSDWANYVNAFAAV